MEFAPPRETACEYTACNVERLLLDDLTGAYQRAGLSELLAVLERQHADVGTPFALAMVDVDHLKTLNDVYGHATGDAALKAVAERSARVMRSGDMLFRYGGDEFLLVLPGTTLEEADRVARRVCDQVTANPVEAAVWVNVNISIGVAASDEADPQPGQPGAGTAATTEPLAGSLADDLFGRADARLYLAKRAGRNMVVASDMLMPNEGEELLRETRLVGRDEQLFRVDTFLAGAPQAQEERVLQLTGPTGVGFTRLLSEVAVRAGIAGMAVRRVEVAPADSGVYLRAVARAYEGRLPPDPAEVEVAEVLARDAEGHGLVLLLEGGQWLDPGSRAVLANRLRKGGARLVEVVPDGEAGAFAAGSAVALAPFGAQQVQEWLGAALGAVVEPATVEALLAASEGRPARMARLMQRAADRLADQGTAPTPERLARVAPALVSALAREAEARELTVSLPRWSEPLVGRSHWLNGAKSTVRGARLTVLVGPGGIGKSRLAAQLALELAHEHPGGAYWVDLRAVKSAQVVPGLLAERLGVEHTEDIEQVAASLGGGPRLIVFDELDGVADQLGFVSALLAGAPAVRVLATSRMPLRMLDERHIEVPELSNPSAVELFRRGMQVGGSDESVSDEDLAALVELVGPSPLSVELAAAWTGALSVSELKEQLEESPQLLIEAPGLEPRTARFIDITRQLMSPWEQETMGTLALMPAGFTAEVARSATAASPFYLLALLERSLARREGERFTVHAAIAERYRAGLHDPDLARTRVVAALAQLAESINDMSGTERSSRGYRITDAERANLDYALRAAARQGNTQAAWPLAELLRGYHDVRGRFLEGLELFRYALQALPAGLDAQLRGWLSETVALFEFQSGESAAAERRLRGTLEELEPLGPSRTLALAWNTLGIITATTERYDEALEALGKSAAMREALGDKVGQAQAAGNVAIVLRSMNEPERALAALQAATANYEAVEHFSGVALSLLYTAEVGREHRLMSLAACAEHATRALELAESLGYAMVARDSAAELAAALEAAERLTEAEAALERALDWVGPGPVTAAETGIRERLVSVREKRDLQTRRLAGRGEAELGSD